MSFAQVKFFGIVAVVALVVYFAIAPRVPKNVAKLLSLGAAA